MITSPSSPLVADTDLLVQGAGCSSALLRTLSLEPWRFQELVTPEIAHWGDFLVRAVRANPSVLSYLAPELAKRHVVMAALQHHDPAEVLRHAKALRYAKATLLLQEWVDLVKRSDRSREYAPLHILLQVDADMGVMPNEQSFRYVPVETLRAMAAHLARDVAYFRQGLVRTEERATHQIARVASKNTAMRHKLSRDIRLLKIAHWRELRVLRAAHRKEIAKTMSIHERHAASVEAEFRQQIDEIDRIRGELEKELAAVRQERDRFRRQASELDAAKGAMLLEMDAARRSVDGMKQSEGALKKRVEASDEAARQAREAARAAQQEQATALARAERSQSELARAAAQQDASRREAENLRARVAELTASLAAAAAALKRSEAPSSPAPAAKPAKPARPAAGQGSTLLKFFDRVRYGSGPSPSTKHESKRRQAAGVR